jgi:uncharacterized protein with PIN domain
MNRIGKAYEFKFRALLGRVHARRLEQGVRWSFTKAQRLGEREEIALSYALTKVYEQTRRKIERWQDQRQADGAGSLKAAAERIPVRLLCDVGLGGLARWLRAAGHEALWQPRFEDDELLREARRISATLLTTDSLLMERRVLRKGEIAALWVPPTLRMQDQLAVVFRELLLPLLEPRCMHCGGNLRTIEKEKVSDRIPPRTYRWLNEYFVCTRCDKLFWHGTHWQKISQCLTDLHPAREECPKEKT